MPITATLADLEIAVADCTPLRVHGSGTDSFTAVTTDSRELLNRGLFVARFGAESDGHQFLPQAFAAGASGVLIEKKWWEAHRNQQLLLEGRFILAVEDTTRALGKLAGWWRRNLNLPTLALTGSNGKTSTREVCESLLLQLVGSGTASIKSHNNHVGLPQTILRSSPDDKWMLLEAGMNHAGELDYLGDIASPDVAVLLNIGYAHFENFGSLAGIADAKFELLRHARRSVVLNADDEEVLAGQKRAFGQVRQTLRALTFGTSESSDYCAKAVVANPQGGTQFRLCLKHSELPAFIPLIGSHNLYNALAAVAGVHELFPALELGDLVRALAQTTLPQMRLEQVRLRSGRIVINDAYNANPTSMRAALQTTKALAKTAHFGCVLGDMLELGERSGEFHRQAGQLASELGASVVVAIGKHSADVAAGANSVRPGSAWAVSEVADIFTYLNQQPEIEFILVKGSRGMKLERVVDELIRREDALPSTGPTS